MSAASPERPTTDDETGSLSRSRSDPIVVDLEVTCSEELDADRWASLLTGVLTEEGVAAGATVGLTFVGVEDMAELNRAHMGSDGPTDVLAFPIDGREATGAAGGGPPGTVGDIVVCPVVAEANAADHAGTAADELALLVVHGALHLLGHDHAEADERQRMRDRERDLLARLHGPLAGDPWAEP